MPFGFASYDFFSFVEACIKKNFIVRGFRQLRRRLEARAHRFIIEHTNLYLPQLPTKLRLRAHGVISNDRDDIIICAYNTSETAWADLHGRAGFTIWDVDGNKVWECISRMS